MLNLEQNNIHPWQENNWEMLKKIQPQNFQNLLLISDKYIGSEEIIDKYITRLFCHNTCGNCNNCNLLAIKQHPDLYYLGQSFVDETLVSNKITIDDVRNMIEQINLKPNFSNYKVIYINNCNLLNTNSANALLKILEEPPQYVKFILLAYNINDILPTILSRCKKLFMHMNHKKINNINFSEKNFNNKEDFWSNYNKYEPLNEQIISDNVLKALLNCIFKPSIQNIYNISDLLYKEDVSLEFLINFKLKLIHDLLLFLNSQTLNFFTSYIEEFKELIQKTNIAKLYQFHDYLIFLFPWRNHSINYKLQVENILFQYQDLLTN